MDRNAFKTMDRKIRRNRRLDRQGRFAEASASRAEIHNAAGFLPPAGIPRAYALELAASYRRRGELPPAGVDAFRSWLRSRTIPADLP